MKVALLTNFIPPYRKSLYQAIATKIETLNVLISVKMEESRTWDVDHHGLNVIVQRNLSFSKRWEDGYQSQIHFPYDTLQQLNRLKPDVVISVELGLRSLFSSIYCTIKKKPLILWLAISEHTEKERKGARLFLRKYLLKKASAVLCNGESSKNYVHSLNKNIETFFIPCTTDYHIGSPKREWSSQKIKIFYSGQLVPRKGIKEMANSLSNWLGKNKNKHIELVVAGAGPEKVYLENLSQIENFHLVVLGEVVYEQLRGYYEESDFYIFPSLNDEWGVVVNEALACGTPVIGSIYSQATLELVENDNTGWQYDPLSENDLGKVLSSIFNINNLNYEKMSTKCIQKVAQITSEKIAEKIVEVTEYVKVL